MELCFLAPVLMVLVIHPVHHLLQIILPLQVLHSPLVPADKHAGQVGFLVLVVSLVSVVSAKAAMGGREVSVGTTLDTKTLNALMTESWASLN